MQSTDNPFKEGTEETKQELPDASDDSDAYNYNIPDNMLGASHLIPPAPRADSRHRSPRKPFPGSRLRRGLVTGWL